MADLRLNGGTCLCCGGALPKAGPLAAPAGWPWRGFRRSNTRLWRSWGLIPFILTSSVG